MSAHAANPLLRLTSGNTALCKTCLRLSFQLPLTPVQIQAVASRVLQRLNHHMRRAMQASRTRYLRMAGKQTRVGNLARGFASALRD